MPCFWTDENGIKRFVRVVELGDGFTSSYADLTGKLKINCAGGVASAFSDGVSDVSSEIASIISSDEESLGASKADRSLGESRLVASLVSAEIASIVSTDEPSLGASKADRSLGASRADLSLGASRADRSLGESRLVPSLQSAEIPSIISTDEPSLGASKADRSLGESRLVASLESADIPSLGASRADRSLGASRADRSLGASRADRSKGESRLVPSLVSAEIPSLASSDIPSLVSSEIPSLISSEIPSPSPYATHECCCGTLYLGDAVPDPCAEGGLLYCVSHHAPTMEHACALEGGALCGALCGVAWTGSCYYSLGCIDADQPPRYELDCVYIEYANTCAPT